LDLENSSQPSSSEQRVRLDICYHGANFCGWQIQPDQKSIQGELMQAFSKLCDNEPRVIGAGRTDAGVHAYQQVAHVDLENFNKRSEESWLNALNSLTDPNLWVTNIAIVEDDFHARFLPHTKTYQYHVEWSPYPNPFYAYRRFHLRTRHFNFELVKEFLKAVKGEHDFKNYCSINNATDTTIRTIVKSELVQIDEHNFYFEFQGKGFLQHMVRILTGTAIYIGLERVNLETALKALQKDDMRDQLGVTLPPHGLVLASTRYV